MDNELTRLFRLLKRIYDLFRPKFYNRITWVVVLSGLGLISTKPFEVLLHIALNVTFGIRITDGQDAEIGVILIAIALLYNAFMALFSEYLSKTERRKELAKQREHDESVFGRMNAILNEQYHTDIMSSISSDHSCSLQESNVLYTFFNDLSQTNNSYLIDEIETAKNRMCSALSELKVFMAFNFFPHHGMLCLDPENNIDRTNSVGSVDRACYEEKAKRLDDLVNAASAAFAEYRKTIKRNLYI